MMRSDKCHVAQTLRDDCLVLIGIGRYSLSSYATPHGRNKASKVVDFESQNDLIMGLKQALSSNSLVWRAKSHATYFKAKTVLYLKAAFDVAVHIPSQHTSTFIYFRFMAAQTLTLSLPKSQSLLPGRRPRRTLQRHQGRTGSR